MIDLNAERERRRSQSAALDPEVYCDCFRLTLRLSEKLAGGVCAACREDAETRRVS